MKRIAALVIVAVCIFALTACDLLSYLPDSSDDKPEDNQPHVCEFTVESKKTQYLKTRANCLKRAEYYYSCECGKAGAEVFTFGDFGNHDFSIKSAIQKYLKEEATVRTAAI